MAIPTTLSGAEMTRGHRHAAGVDEATPRVRCAVVVYDPALAASQPRARAGGERAQRARPRGRGAVHGRTPTRSRRSPRTTPRAGSSARSRGAEPDRDELALGALLAGYTIDSTGFGLHHVLAQTLVRHGLAGHGQANAIMLPHTIPALARRCPERARGAHRGARRGPGGGRRAALRAHGRDAAARPRRARGGPRRRARTRPRRGRSSPHAAAGGPRRAARALRGRVVTRAPLAGSDGGRRSPSHSRAPSARRESPARCDGASRDARLA